MQLAYPQNDTRAETLRYLGAGGWQPDAASQVLLQKAEDALRAAATPRGVWKQLPLTALPLQNAGNDIAPVSYTHLDVYKRQVSGREAGRHRCTPSLRNPHF